MTLTPEQLLWLSANKEGYELILMHSVLHDRMRRTAMLGVPLVARDFASPSLSAILQGLVLAESVMKTMNATMPFPPTVDQLQTYMLAATKEKESLVTEDELPAAFKVLELLQSPHRADQWYFLDTYFTAWLSSVRAKGYARKAQMNQIANAAEMSALIEGDIRRARAAIYSQDSDDMYQALYGVSEAGKIRRPSGFPALDEATGGGWGESECYGLFAGTKGGKTVCAAQVGWHNAFTDGDTLILSTEMKAIDYIVKIVANACNIKISLIKDCLNVGQLRSVIAMDNPAALDRVEIVIATIIDRIRIVKLHPDQGLSARAVMEQETQAYEQLKGRRPTLVIFDWLGRIADSGGSKNSSDRVMMWERAADSCVQYCEVSGIPALILLQAVNDAASKSILSLEDVGISKGVFKQFTMAFGITNTIDKAAVKQALMTGELQAAMRTTLDNQTFCVVASRRGESTYIPVTRQFLYQRFGGGKRAA